MQTLKGNHLSYESSLGNNENDNTKGRMTPQQVLLLQGWTSFKFGAYHAHTNYLKLLLDIALRGYVVKSTFVVLHALAFSISPSIGEWAVHCTLQALYALSFVEIVLLFPFFVFLAIVLLWLPTPLADWIMNWIMNWKHRLSALFQNYT